MPKMIALSKFRYPSGPSGKEYNSGDELDVSSDRDAKALRLVKRAKDAPVTQPAAEPPKSTRGGARPKLDPYKTTAMAPAAEEAKPFTTTEGRPGTYSREDMTAETAVGHKESEN
jgi:hypothetical protein